MTRELLDKYLSNTCTEAELDEVLNWVAKGSLEKEGREWAQRDWAMYREENMPEDDHKFSVLFDKIQEEIKSRARKNYKKTHVFLPLFTKWITRAAAILLIPTLTFLFYTISEKRILKTEFTNAVVDSLEIIAPMGSRTVVELSDGSRVHLNYGSRIKYPQFFLEDRREIALEGEAYFEVAHNPEKPFIVKTGKLNVIALGTAFNVLAQADDHVVETTLVNGKVVLESEMSGGEKRRIGAMTPGQHVKYNVNTGNISSTKGNIEKYIAWKDGKLIFEDSPMAEVVEKLSRIYNVDIELAAEVKDYNYTFVFIDEPLYQILDLMSIATPIKYKSFPRKKLTNGTYSKQRIIIQKK